MFSKAQKQRFQEVARQASRWYFNNQNCDSKPWGGMRDSSDKGRFVYEYYPASGLGRGAGVWAQALGIMALGSANIGEGKSGFDWWKRIKSIEMAADYMSRLQINRPDKLSIHGGFSEHVPGETDSYPRDAATGGIGMCVLNHITKKDEYLQRAIDFANWYRDYGSENGWPYISYDLKDGKGTNMNIEPGQESRATEFIKGDWQAGGGLTYYYLAKLTGEQKYIDDYLVPLMDKLVDLYHANPFEKAEYGFHGEVPVSFGNDDFALVTLLGAYAATKNKKYYTAAKDRIDDFKKFWDEDTGRFPSYGGTFVSGITMKVLLDVEEAYGLGTSSSKAELQSMIQKTALGGVELQAFDYNTERIHGGFWGQSEYGVSRDRIHHRSTGYATVFYSMVGYDTLIPYYHVLGWDKK